MRTYFAYIRVSTARQGERGSSLIEQRSAIERYAIKHGLHVSDWFEERVTAAKRGRTVFRRMLTRLKKGNAHGLIMHKVDRGARNLADWAELAALMDLGIDIHFAHEALDLSSRGGRLSADIQAVVAADYIRNLRQEVKKGMYGRLKQGILPYGAPPGYQNNGEGGQQKTIDPIQGPLVRETFERYATGDYSYYTLTAFMTKRGLRNKAGKPFPVTGICKLLRNTYYYGIITTKGQTFAGSHEPLISKELFDRCKAQREGRVAPRPEPNGLKEFALRRMMKCAGCDHSLIAERQSGLVYYRCHTKTCPSTCIRETAVLEQLRTSMSAIENFAQFAAAIARMLAIHETKRDAYIAEQFKPLALRRGQIASKQDRLTQLLIEDAIDRQTYDSQKFALQNELIDLAGREATLNAEPANRANRLEGMLEVAKALQTLPETENPREKRKIIKTATSKIFGYEKTIVIQWSKGFSALFSLGTVPSCGLEQDELRRIHSVTGSDEIGKIDITSITDDQRESLLDAILSDESFDLVSSHNNNDNSDDLFSLSV